MKALLTAAAILDLTVLAGGRVQQAPPPAARLRVDAVAFDRQGKAVEDLRREDLEVWINRYRVPVESVTVATRETERGGRLTVLVLDNVTTDPAMAPRVREVARRFVTLMSPGDEMAIVPLDGGALSSTDDRARLLRSIEEYNALQSGLIQLDRLGEHVLATMAALARQLAEAPGRKTIVGIGAAWLFDTPIPPPTIGRDLRPEWVDAMRTSALSNATVYVIDPGGVGTSRLVGNGTGGFARETGGHAFLNTNDFSGAVDRIMRESASYYVIEVGDPPFGRKSDLRQLDVRSLRRGVTARARRWIPGKL
jgi:VWFA-related protein